MPFKALWIILVLAAVASGFAATGIRAAGVNGKRELNLEFALLGACTSAGLSGGLTLGLATGLWLVALPMMAVGAVFACALLLGNNIRHR